jgi:hypothetical protein
MTLPRPLVMFTRKLLVLLALMMVAGPASAIVPFGFSDEVVATGFNLPVRVIYDPAGRAFVGEKGGVIWIVDTDGTVLATPLIDLQDEVHAQHDKGMLGFTLDPDYANNGYIYLLYNVDPVFGEPDESSESATFGRVTRYAVVGNQVDPGPAWFWWAMTPATGSPTATSRTRSGAFSLAMMARCWWVRGMEPTTTSSMAARIRRPLTPNVPRPSVTLRTPVRSVRRSFGPWPDECCESIR